MNVDFDQIIDRSNTNAVARHGFRRYLFDGDDFPMPCDDDDAMSMWVADMAFASAPAAVDAMRARLDHPIFGYTAVFDDELFDAYRDWCVEQYDWKPERDHFLTSPGVVPALYDLVEHILKPGEQVLTLTPAYGHFKNASDYHGINLVTSGLIEDENGRFDVDFADLEAKLADPSMRMFFLCHPHNPTGRVFSDDELRRMAELCFANDVLVVSDEIHCDLLRHGVTHTPMVKLFPDSDQIITCMSASKTFNLAGLGTAIVIIPNDEIRDVWVNRNSPIVNPISIAGAAGCFRNGHEWRDQLRTYLDANFAYAKEVLTEQLPDAVFPIPDATYLAWIDLRHYFEPGTNLTRFFAEHAGVVLEGGDMFISDGDGHIRVNFACPRATLAKGLDRIVAAVHEHTS
ncbi:MAG: putative C-S lyase [Acidimicrobiales bacterium]|nr:putative C-S lyase [Acidimicrobiales bacterium]